ncbi:MAG: hypothetical protein OEM50_00115 [Gammaproteobacteria bacterium]|nr:hypothetical protein [Gammaproteobacteria bacterium]MDH3362505.1 hypothetical protein [Gammaproteobacteria bacterium]MDH3480086.1 hypothetical protein [Gammaproteobacteria bacterium]
MKPNTRSASGALLMLMIVPVIVGLLACMPVPIGDPERSRIDPAITGVWVLLDGTDSSFFAFEPYDKRTWLLTGVPIDAGDEAALDDFELENYSDLADFIDAGPVVGRDGLTAGKIANYKVWRTKLGGEWFMTWEPKTVFDNESFLPEVWFVFRLERPDEDTLVLTMLDDDLFDGIEETRRAYEGVIKRHAGNEALYSEEVARLRRVQPEHLVLFRRIAADVLETD